MKYIVALSFINLFLCFSCKNSVTQNTEPEPQIVAKEYAIPFSLLENGSRVVLKGIFKDSVYLFLLDNGYPLTCLTQTLFTRYYDTTEFKIYDPDWKFDGQICIVPNQIKFGDYDFLFDTVHVFDLPSRYGRKVLYKGIIDVELFRRHIVELNFEDSVMTLKNRLPENIGEYMSFDLKKYERCEFKADTMLRYVEISGFYDKAGVPFTGKFQVDLGAPYLAFYKTIREKTNFDLSKQDTTTLVSLILNNGTMLNNTHFRSASATSGYIDIETRLGNGALGTPFFVNFHVIFDYPHNKLYLKRNKLPCKFEIF